MKLLWALVLALGCVHVHGAPLEQAGMEEGSCEDAFAVSAARQALNKINMDREEGYIFGLHRLSNVHMMKHGETGVVFYLTLDVVETNCSVLSKRDFKTCEARPTHATPVYGQCKAAIYMNKVHRVVRLYKYSCEIRPVPAARVGQLCPDCPSLIDMNNDEVKKTVSLSLEKFNRESGLGNRFALLKVSRAVSGMGMVTHYNVEYTIQETTCPRSTEAPTAEQCPLMDCEFAHKGFCKASLYYSPDGEGSDISVECEIFEAEAAERQKKLHLLGGETDHSHNDTHHAHDGDQPSGHDHVHDHTKDHVEHGKSQLHDDKSNHHHTHDHGVSSSHKHAHDHSHDHGHYHDHVHSHHAKAHDHSGDLPKQHHGYKHADGETTKDHDHELALDHHHKHAHLHDHEHHHHHHDHDHEATYHDNPKGMVRMLPAMDQPMTLPSFPDVPAAGPEVGVTLPLKEDPQIPGEMEPTIEAFPTAGSSQCTAPAAGSTLVEKLFAEDPLFKAAA